MDYQARARDLLRNTVITPKRPEDVDKARMLEAYYRWLADDPSAVKRMARLIEDGDEDLLRELIFGWIETYPVRVDG